MQVRIGVFLLGGETEKNGRRTCANALLFIYLQ